MFDEPDQDRCETVAPIFGTVRTTLVDIAYEHLKEQIFARSIEPGEPIPVQVVAEQLEMSITPVREALTRAVEFGLATSDVNHGYRATHLLDSAQLHHLLDARLAIELGATRGNELHGPHWIESIGEEDVRVIAELVSKMGRVRPVDNYRQYTTFSRLDGELHGHLVRLSGNQFLMSAWEGLHYHLHVSRLYGGLGVVDYECAHREHLALVEALSARDGRLLAELCESHIRGAEVRLTSFFNLTTLSRSTLTWYSVVAGSNQTSA